MSSDSIYSGGPGDAASFADEPPFGASWWKRRKLLAGLGSLLLVAGTVATIVAATSAAAPAGASAMASGGSTAVYAATLMDPAAGHVAAGSPKSDKNTGPEPEFSIKAAASKAAGGHGCRKDGCADGQYCDRKLLTSHCVQCPSGKTSDGRLATSTSECRLPPLDVHLAYGFRVDADSPGFLAPMMRLFLLDEADIEYVQAATFDGKIEYSTNDNNRATSLALEAHLEGGIRPFSAAASMEASDSSSSDIRTARLDVTQRFTKKRATSSALSLNPEAMLSPDAEQFIQDTALEDVEQIAEAFGVFYARAANLGGLVRKTYIMEVTEDDTQSSLVGELDLAFNVPAQNDSPAEAEFKKRRDCEDQQVLAIGPESHGRPALYVSGGVSAAIGSDTSHCGAAHKTIWRARGGDPLIWESPVEGPGGKSLDDLQKEWQASFDDESLLSWEVDMGDLRPIWHIVAKVDQRKGERLEELLTARGGEESGSQFSPTQFFEARVGCTDQAATNYDTQHKFACDDCCHFRGCTNLRAVNYVDHSPHTTTDDGSCKLPGEITWPTALAVSGSTIVPPDGGFINGVYVRMEQKKCNRVPVYEHSHGRYILFQPEDILLHGRTIWKTGPASSATLCRNDGWVVSRAGMCPTRPDDPDCTNNWLEWDRHHSYSEGPWKESSITVRESIQPRG